MGSISRRIVPLIRAEELESVMRLSLSDNPSFDVQLKQGN